MEDGGGWSTHAAQISQVGSSSQRWRLRRATPEFLLNFQLTKNGVSARIRRLLLAVGTSSQLDKKNPPNPALPPVKRGREKTALKPLPLYGGGGWGEG